MKDEDKTKKQILSELMKLRQRVAELEVSENNHKQAEKKLQKSEKKYRTLIDNIPQRIFHKDKNHVYVSCNDNYAQDLDITPDQVTGKTDFDFYSKELAEKYRADDKRIIGSGKVEELEEDYVLPDGQRFIVQTVKAPVRDEKGEITGILGIFMDITERKRSEEAFKKTKDHLDNIIESSLDVVVVSDSRGYITRVNKSFFKLTGYSEKEAIGKHITEFTPYEEGTYESTSGEMIEIKEFISDTLEVIEKTLFAEGKTFNWETYYLCKDGKVVPVETNIAYLYNEEGEAIGSVGVNRDISERKRSERKIAEYQNELRSFASQLTSTEEKERQKFATYLHDQIGQKLFVSKLKLEMLKESESLKEMVKSSEVIFKLIDQIINETRNLTFELSPPILYQLGLEAAIEWLTEQTYKQHSIVVDFEDDKREKTVDEDMKILLFQAVRELLTNIAKHAQSQKAKVSIKRDKTHLRVCVEDDGVGFTPLGKDSSKDKNEGFGLFSIKERLDHLGGHLKITSHPGLGTQATLLAPLKGKKESLNRK
jgi:PAS domain S-box-containing protein